MSGDPLELAYVRQLYADARAGFAQDVDVILERLARWFDQTGASTANAQTWSELRAALLQKFDQRLPGATAAADPLLLQLVREAFDLECDPDSKVDRRDWRREAKKVLNAR